MDQSFNDQELSDIMKEIEALEQGFKSEETGTPVAVAEEFEPKNEFEEIKKIDSMNASSEVEEVTTVDSTNNVLSLETSPNEAYIDKHTSSPAFAASVHSSSMTFKVQGNLSLDLKFEIGGKVVCVEVSETEFSIEMEGGMKFTVPVQEKSGFKKAV